ncbi:MAG: flagellar protein FliT [Gammaproteobacteria bacterium]|jgi:hypothetical protein|nr:flagellar protein FliT [Gammaproteobacteria bacterium]MBT5205219.1 flagellar protein FliT [Gammaproteobacteria bacterium]MBT6247501.1 flagellar protein FliT [Gammaproteobacteria bacterium]
MPSRPEVAVFPAVGKIAELRLRQLDEIAALTRQMLILAEQGEWPELAELQHRRDLQLQTCFAAPLSPDDTATAIDKIRHLLGENERVLAVICRLRDKLEVKLRGVHQKHKMVDTYLQTGL